MKTSVRLIGLLTGIVVMGWGGSASAQALTQTIRGAVQDKTSQQPMVGATVYVLPKESGLGTSTDQYGRFQIDNVPVGRRSIAVSFTGYKTEIINNLLVISSKETVLTLSLEQAPYELEEVQVSGESEGSSFERIGNVEITAEHFQRIAANYLDPARVVLSSPSIASTNDQNNAISVRGNSPIANTWRLEGVEIVNPNHLANAGTISDRPTQNGGGVNVLSTQMLDNSSFLMGYMPAGYGNAIGGIFDMNLRAGNNQQREYTAQASLIGLDVAAEGPFKKGGKASYLVNYRYSFTGVLAAMGVNFGGETIKFQDLSFNVSLPETAIGKVTAFGVNGWNSNVYRGVEDPADAVEEKELSDIDYGSSIYAYGITQEASVGKNSSWKNVVVYSSTDTERDQTALVFNSNNLFVYNEDGEKSTKLSFASEISSKWGERVSGVAGVRGTHYSWNLNESELANQPEYEPQYLGRDFDLSGLILQPFVQTSFKLASDLNLDLGLNSSWFDYTAEFNLEPRLNIDWALSPSFSFHGRTGLYSQVLSPYAYNTSSTAGIPVPIDQRNNDGLQFIKSWVSEAGFSTGLGKSLKLTTDVFYQYLYDVPQYTFGNDFYSYGNYDGEDYLSTLNSAGEGRTYGVSVEAKQSIVNGFYIWTGGTLYRSEYQGQTGEFLPSKFDGRYNFNLTLGKEYQKKKSDNLERIFGVHSRVFYQGGFRQQPLNADWSEYDVQLGDYFRVDLRVQWTRFKPKYTRLVAIDIQNVLNIENPAYFYYDSVQGKEVLKNQLGIIPVVVYRIDF